MAAPKTLKKGTAAFLDAQKINEGLVYLPPAGPCRHCKDTHCKSVPRLSEWVDYECLETSPAKNPILKKLLANQDVVTYSDVRKALYKVSGVGPPHLPVRLIPPLQHISCTLAADELYGDYPEEFNYSVWMQTQHQPSPCNEAIVKALWPQDRLAVFPRDI